MTGERVLTLVALKIFAIAFIFVVTGGAITSNYAKRRPVLVLMSMAVSLLGAFYLFRDVYNDLKFETVSAVKDEN